MYIDDTLYVSDYPLIGYKFDWNVVGVEEEANPNIPAIYPNQTNNSIVLNIDKKFYNGQWQLTDLSGRDNLNGIKLSNPQLQLDISNLPSATYYLQLQKGTKSITYKIQKI